MIRGCTAGGDNNRNSASARASVASATNMKPTEVEGDDHAYRASSRPFTTPDTTREHAAAVSCTMSGQGQLIIWAIACIALGIVAFRAYRETNQEKLIAAVFLALLVCSNFLQIYPNVPSAPASDPSRFSFRVGSQ